MFVKKKIYIPYKWGFFAEAKFRDFLPNWWMFFQRYLIEMPVKNQLQGMLEVFEPLDRAQSKKNFEPSFVKIG